jgi:hypothetical protein
MPTDKKYKTQNQSQSQNQTKSQNKNNNINGGGIFGKSKLTLKTIVNNTKHSETKFINTFEEQERFNINYLKLYEKMSHKYSKAYAEHLKNLELLDDRINFHGMVNVFKNLIMKYNINTDKIDKDSPLFFRNYLVSGDDSPSTFRSEHLKQQIDFFMRKYFTPSDRQFIKYIETDTLTTTSFSLNITTIDNKKYKNKIAHNEYIIDKNEIKQTLKDIIHTTKKNLKRDSGVISYKHGDTKSTSSRKSASVKSSKKKHNTHNKHNTKTKKSNTVRTLRSRGKDKHKNDSIVNLLQPKANSKKGINNINSKLKSIFKSHKREQFSIEKSRGQLDREKKDKNNKERVEREEKEKKARQDLYQDTPEGIISKKCNLYTDQPTCIADTDCFFNLNINKCLRSNRVPGAPGATGAPGAPIAPPTTVSGLTQNLIKIPELLPSNNEKKL